MTLWTLIGLGALYYAGFLHGRISARRALKDALVDLKSDLEEMRGLIPWSDQDR